jgi:hypothetical protein
MRDLIRDHAAAGISMLMIVHDAADIVDGTTGWSF